jgi:peptidoglycan-N-acetylmuramic acid deacetylase
MNAALKSLIAISSLCASLYALAQNAVAPTSAAAQCKKPLYFTFDTGHMEVAPLVADVLVRQQIKVTFFVANEKTKSGGGSLDEKWLPWWKARAQEGHLIGSHTWDHSYWAGDLPDGRVRIKPSAGEKINQTLSFDRAQYCAEIRKPLQALEAAGIATVPLFRAPGGKTSPRLLAWVKDCGYAHVGWSPAGFLGDELSSDKYSNHLLLNKALREIRSGDILLAHLGIWSRKDAWAPVVLEPLIEGLKARGFCFETLASHPDYAAFLKTHKSP